MLIRMSLRGALVAACALAPTTALAQAGPANADADSDRQVLEPIVITADPFATRGELDVAAPTTVVTGEELRRARAGTIGETLNSQPGVSNSSFGPGAGRVVIRGQSGPRVRVLSDGLGAQDVSVTSPDHAVTVEAFRAEQIEVIRGPATLQYGSGAIGGVVNVVEHAIADAPFDGVAGEFGGQLQSDRGGRTGYAGLTAGNGPLVLHVDALRGRTGLLEIPGFGDPDAPEEDPDAVPGILENSQTERDSAVLGLSWVGERGYIGGSVTHLTHTYGLPGGHGHGHEEEEGEEHDDEEHDDEEHEEEHGEEEEEGGVFLDIEQTRSTIKGELFDPAPGLTRLRGAVTVSEYEHTEFEGPGEPGTLFNNDSVEGRLEATHAPLGPLSGVLGVQLQQREFSAVGEEAFVPPVDTDLTGIFLIEEAELGAVRLEAGARIEQVDHQPASGAGSDFSPVSVSLGAVWRPADQLSLALRASRSERAPVAEELFSNGPHLATESFELGDAGLNVETANTLDLSARLETDRWFARASVFVNQFDDFIYQTSVDNNGDGEADRVDEEGELEDDGELLLVNYVQDNADFVGGEVELGGTLYRSAQIGAFGFRVFGDTVSAELDGGQNLPRITPTRLGLEGNWSRGWVSTRLALTEVDDQTDTAPLESATAGYSRLDADLELRIPRSATTGTWVLGLRGRNLLDEDIRQHTSFLKEFAPEAGVGILLDLQAEFGAGR